MKLAVYSLAATVVVAVAGGTASAQQVIVTQPAPVVVPAYPAYQPGVTIGGAIRGPGGIVIGGSYSTPVAPAYGPVVAGPPVVAAPPVVVAPPVIGVGIGVPLYRPGYYPYYYGPHYHRR